MEYRGFELWQAPVPGCRKAWLIDNPNCDLTGVHWFRTLKAAKKAIDDLIDDTFIRTFATRWAAIEYATKVGRNVAYSKGMWSIL